MKHSVMFPHQIGLAATRNQELVQETARITSYESRAASLPWTYNPNADVSSSPCGVELQRVSERILIWFLK